MEFTNDQKEIINERGHSLLVTAAAGSGKTAVLVQRILERVCDKNKPIDIDHILCLTFTEAAAAEMKARLLKRINERILENPDDVHLQHQAVLVHRSFIMTIDAFCNYIVANHFQEIGLEPGMKIMDGGQEKIVRQTIIDDFFEELYLLPEENEKRKGFINAIESLSEKGDDKELQNLIFKITDSASSYPYPEDWLKNALEQYKMNKGEDPKWMDGLLESVLFTYQEAIDFLNKALEICDDIGYEAGANIVQSDIDGISVAFEKAKNAGTKKEALTILGDFLGDSPNKAFVTWKKDKNNPDESETIKNLRNTAKELLKGLGSDYFDIPFDKSVKMLESLAPLVETIINLAREYTARFENQKKDYGLMTFNDCEHYALNILTRQENGVYVPTETALELADFFEEVMCDEYQDSNEIQEAILDAVSREESGVYNRFMVGDVKQSIYRFRKANPALIMSKMAEYGDKGSDKRRIDLSFNFRSRINVLNTSNSIFEKIMRKEFGGISYDDRARLYLGAADYDSSAQNLASELHILEQDISEDTEESKLYQHAKMLAHIVKENVGITDVSDYAQNEGEIRPLRKASYKDIAILLRNMKMAEELTEVFKEEGIPLYVTSSKGYYDSPEVVTIISYLRIIENPRQDLALYRVMTSPICGFTDEELAIIKSQSDRATCFFDRVKNFTASNSNELQEKCQLFLDNLNSYRAVVTYENVSGIISRILEDTGFLHFISAMPNGEQRVRNIDLLLDKAKSFEKNGESGLYRFIDYINLSVSQYGDDMGPASMIDENADMVRVYTIHKSKGLEFPICIVADLDHGFNTQDARVSFLMDAKYGVACKFYDPVRRIKRNTILHKFFAQRETLETKAEELRLLYVAATRAKEKLIFAGTVKPSKKNIESGTSKAQQEFDDAKAMLDQRLDDKLFAVSQIKSNNNLLGYVLLGLCDDPSVLRIHTFDELADRKEKEMIDMAARKNSLPSIIENNKFKDEVIEEFSERFSLSYAHPELEGLFTKTSVSELKKSAYIKQVDESREDSYHFYLPNVGDESKGTEYGTAHHRVLELLEFSPVVMADSKDDAIDEINRQIDRMVMEKLIPGGYKELVSPERIYRFSKNDSAKRMAQAEKTGNLFKEQPFFLGVGANLLKDSFPEDETLIVQGIIDVYFEEDGELVLLDYKTDRVNTTEELVKRYETQLYYYKLALENATGKKVKECILYSFCLDEEKVIYDPKEHSNI